MLRGLHPRAAQKGGPPPAPVEWHAVITKLREEAEDPKKRIEVERMGSALAKLQKKLLNK
jgi:hypothetical protein